MRRQISLARSLSAVKLSSSKFMYWKPRSCSMRSSAITLSTLRLRYGANIRDVVQKVQRKGQPQIGRAHV